MFFLRIESFSCADEGELGCGQKVSWVELADFLDESEEECVNRETGLDIPLGTQSNDPLDDMLDVLDHFNLLARLSIKDVCQRGKVQGFSGLFTPSTSTSRKPPGYPVVEKARSTPSGPPGR